MAHYLTWWGVRSVLERWAKRHPLYVLTLSPFRCQITLKKPVGRSSYYYFKMSNEHDGIINWFPQKYLVDRIEMILTSLRILFSFTQGRDRCALAIWETWLVWRTTVRVHYVNDRNLLYLPLYFTADLGETKTLCGWLLQQRGAATTPHAPLSSKATNP